MFFIPFAYLCFGFLFGVILMIYHYLKGYKFKEPTDLFWLLLPCYGWGNLIYNKAEKTLPKKYHVWKKMTVFHTYFIIICGSLGLFFMLDLFDLIGSGTDWADNQDNPTATGFGYLADLGILLITALIVGGYIAIMGLLSLILILLPKVISLRIERNFYKKQSKE